VTADLPYRSAAMMLPDMGSLLEDLRTYLADSLRVLTHPLARVIIPDLLAETARNPELATAFLASVRGPRRANAARLIEQAVACGELPATSTSNGRWTSSPGRCTGAWHFFTWLAHMRLYAGQMSSSGGARK
jgi:hypothetical protein